MKTSDLAIILGSTIENNGELSKIAVERLDAALEFSKKNKNSKLIITGGFGDHFNKTTRAYSLYAQEYLLKKGINSNQIAALVPSLDTVEDAKLSLGIVRYLNPKNIHVLTSDFHIKRVKYIFEIVFSGSCIDYLAVPHMTDENSMKELIEKEVFELSNLRSTGKSSLGSTLV